MQFNIYGDLFIWDTTPTMCFMICVVEVADPPNCVRFSVIFLLPASVSWANPFS